MKDDLARWDRRRRELEQKLKTAAIELRQHVGANSLALRIDELYDVAIQPRQAQAPVREPPPLPTIVPGLLTSNLEGFIATREPPRHQSLESQVQEAPVVANARRP